MILGFATNNESDISPDYTEKIGIEVILFSIIFSDDDCIMHKK